MNEHQILATYERIARVTRQMLTAAQAGQWDRLTTLENECSTLFGPLIEHDRRPPIPHSRPLSRGERGGSSPPSPPGRREGMKEVSAEYVRRKAELIRDILADDAQIRVLVEPQLESLSALLGASRQKQRLVRAYETDG